MVIYARSSININNYVLLPLYLSIYCLLCSRSYSKDFMIITLCDTCNGLMSYIIFLFNRTWLSRKHRLGDVRNRPNIPESVRNEFEIQSLSLTISCNWRDECWGETGRPFSSVTLEWKYLFFLTCLALMSIRWETIQEKHFCPIVLRL